MRVASDVGGTFTDLVYYEYDEKTGEVGEIGTEKSDTTPPNFEEGVLNTIHRSDLKPADISFFAHGTTVVINALTERKGAKTGLITTKGFRDILEITRGNRPDIFNFYFSKPEPFVPRHLRREVEERTEYTGEILTQLKLGDLAAIVDDFKSEDVTAVAICFLHSYANPENEIRAAEELSSLWPEVSVVASHRISREWREYERTSTAVLAAYVHPVINRYLDSLEGRLRSEGFTGQPFVMQSNGGIATIAAGRANPITMVESGPASGVLGAVALGEMIGEPNIIALDIGGTTAKCSLIEDGKAVLTTDYKIDWSRTKAGYPIKTPVIDIVEIGNGGGSIAWIDEGGKLHVGPESAGAQPGPAAYGRGGTEPTTTDAHLITKRIDQDYFLGGEIVPDMDNVRRAFSGLAKRLGVDIDDAARGIIRVANANMVNALKLVSLNKGYDPRDFSLVAYGGGGAMHAGALAAELGMPKAIIPVNPAVFSAWGMLMTDLRRDFLRTRLVPMDEAAIQEVGEMFDGLAEEAVREFAADDVGPDRLLFRRHADMRYVGQDHVVKIEFPDGEVDAGKIAEAVDRYHRIHEREYEFRMDHPVELVNYHLVVFGKVTKPGLAKRRSTGKSLADASRGTREVDFDEFGSQVTAIYERALLEPGMEMDGPVIIEEPATTILVFPGQRGEVDAYGNIHIHLG
ncbi:MAG: hydantoinase/oxoprolinase family protein [Rhodospirillales bacterium]|jgi:N-methylhydantoinase A|nr:5-oxoprolinase [Rhodospirillaceae bacterium]MDP6430107.1 hydantoinase/oxoprolinase family protein [Rhodospirillales bacterium]MDP6642533.1 hydantoinase/oxoprolinase family protein [Rhodospirillales bacterium]MDP6843757.1 hydantoinase/oxoprolinase family protein [Rhodospirillales bacterium]